MNVLKFVFLVVVLGFVVCSGECDLFVYDILLVLLDVFMVVVVVYCGKVFEGCIVVNELCIDVFDLFEGKWLVMYVCGCDDLVYELCIFFYVGDDYLWMWVLICIFYGLCFKYDYCYVDGSFDVISFYGGDSKLLGIV